MPRKFYSLNDIAAIRGNPGAMLWELHQAAAYGDKERVLECLEAGADINGRNPDFGVTALMLAAAGGYWEIAKLFLDRGAAADVRDHGGLSALDWAGARGWDDLEELIRSRLPMPQRVVSLSNAREPRVNGNIPPFLLLHGSKDVLIPAEGCKRFRSALREHGVDVEVRIDPETTHWHRESLKFVPEFFKSKLKS